MVCCNGTVSVHLFFCPIYQLLKQHAMRLLLSALWTGDISRLPHGVPAAVPPQPQDSTVSVIVLFTIVSSCVTDCNF